MNLKEIKELIEIIDNSNLTGFELENAGVRLVLKKEGVAAASNVTGIVTSHPVQVNSVVEKAVEVKEPEGTAGLIEITSPIVGTFYVASSPGSEPYVSVGDVVKKDQVLCIVEAMKLMNEITAEFNCEIVKMLVKNEEMVQYGQPLFVVRAV